MRKTVLRSDLERWIADLENTPRPTEGVPDIVAGYHTGVIQALRCIRIAANLPLPEERENV